MARMPKESYELEKMKQENKKNSKSIVLGFIFLIIMTAIVLFCIFNFNDFNDTMKVLKSVTGKDILLSIGCLILYILICPISLCILCKVKKLKTNTIQNYLIGASEHFFNGITPYQTGAQPFQVYFFSRRGVKPSEGTGIAITNYLAQLIGLNILMIVSFIYAKDFFGSFVESKTVWIPTPGTSGGIEFSFTVLFALFSGFSGSVAAAAAILWRGITYYILLLVSLIEYLILEIIFKNKKDKKLL